MLKRFRIIAVALTLAGFAGVAAAQSASLVHAQSAAQITSAHEQTARFAIENMTCGLCPVTIKKAMAGVPGVKSVAIDFAAKTASVVFDPSIATSAQISAASANAGYPATSAGRQQ